MSIRKNWTRLSGLALATTVLLTLNPAPTQANQKTISSDLAPLLEKAYNQMMQGQYDPAVETLNKAIKTDKDSITARRYLAFALVKSGRPKESIDQLDLISKSVKPTYFEWCTYGEAYLASGGLDQAESCYKEALKTTPRNAYARSGMIRISIKSGNYDQALDLATEGMKSSRDPEAYNYYKNLYMSALAAQRVSGGGLGSLPKPPGATASSITAEQQRQNQELIKRVTGSYRQPSNRPGK